MKKYTILTIVLLLTVTSCRDFLDEKSSASLRIPETLEDNQALLDRSLVLSSTPNSGEISATDYFLKDMDFTALPAEADKRLYTWQPAVVSIPGSNDWANTYSRINIFNNVLYNLDHYQIANSANVRGQALALRGMSYLNAAQVWSPAYKANDAASVLGLPLRLDPDMNIPSVRASLEQTFQQIISDLESAASLLPESQVSITRPSRATALGYLSRAYLYMGNYLKALETGLAALQIKNELLDYNNLNTAASYPIPANHAELLLPTTQAASVILISKAIVPAELYNLYAENDLRKTAFYRLNGADILFKGNYTGGASRSSALAVDELYLTVAESYVQLGNTTKGLEYLNALLVKRYKAGTYVPYTTASVTQPLELIRTERRKETPMRALRWADLKRYNRDGAGRTLTRRVNGQIFSLPPNDPRWAIAIPEDIIVLTGMPQNPR